MPNVNIALEILSIEVTIILLFYGLLEKEIRNKQTSIFIAMLITNIFVLLCDCLVCILEGREDLEVLLYFLNFMVYSLGYVMEALFTYYVISYMTEKNLLHVQTANVIAVFCVFAILHVVISLYNHMFFSFENGVYVRGPKYWLSQVYPALIILVNMIIIIKNRKKLGLNDTITLLSYGLMPIVALIIQIFIYGITLLYIATTLNLLIMYIGIHIKQGRRLKEKEIELSQMRINIMLSQIQPHFLYNSLNAIYYLCEIDPKQAQKAISEFSMYMRGNLDSLNQKTPISFERELSHIEIYLSLEKMRFQEELNIVYRIECRNFMIPALTVQPLVENAVKYGVGKAENGGTVAISSAEYEDRYEVIVADDGVGYDVNQVHNDERSHTGIDNVRNRLWAMCQATLEIVSNKGIGTVATIKIPRER